MMNTSNNNFIFENKNITNKETINTNNGTIYGSPQDIEG